MRSLLCNRVPVSLRQLAAKTFFLAQAGPGSLAVFSRINGLIRTRSRCAVHSIHERDV